LFLKISILCILLTLVLANDQIYHFLLVNFIAYRQKAWKAFYRE
jgi:hypothetical protein